MTEGFVEYRHPVQGWTMPLPVPDVNDPPEVFFVKGHRLERADMAAPTRQEALALHTARVLQRLMSPGAWDRLPSHEREAWMARGLAVVEALEAEGALA